MGSSRRRSLSESTAPPLIALVAALALYLAAPSTFETSHRLPVAVLVAVGVVLLVIANPRRLYRRTRWSHPLAGTVAVLLAAGNTGAGVDVLIGFGEPGSSGLPRLLVAAFQVGVTQILAFSLIYWVLDRGGPLARRHDPLDRLPEADFDFRGPGRYVDLGSMPDFGDYLVLALRTALAWTGSGPRATTARARLLVGIQSFTGFALLGVVVVKTIVVLVA